MHVGLLLASLGCANAEVRPPTPPPSGADAGAAKDATPNTDQPGKDGAPAEALPPDPCDPFTNSGCPSDQKCTALLQGNAMALGCGAKGTKAEGATCSPTTTGDQQTGDDCGDGLACFRLQNETDFTCRRTCPITGTAHACPTGSICSVRVPGLSSYGFCGPSCKPLEQTGCASGQACYLTSIGATCNNAGSTQAGDSCSQASDCKPGTTCITGLSNGNRCLAFCSTAGSSPSCSGGSTCTKVPIDDVFMSEPSVGYCR